MSGLRVCKQMLDVRHLWTVPSTRLECEATTMSYPGGEVLTISAPSLEEGGMRFRAACTVSVLYHVQLTAHLTPDRCAVAVVAHREMCEPFLLKTVGAWIEVLCHITRLTICHLKELSTNRRHEVSEIELLYDGVSVEGVGLPFRSNPFMHKRRLKAVYAVDTFVKGVGRKRVYHARLKLVDVARDFAKAEDGMWAPRRDPPLPRAPCTLRLERLLYPWLTVT